MNVTAPDLADLLTDPEGLADPAQVTELKQNADLRSAETRRAGPPDPGCTGRTTLGAWVVGRRVAYWDCWYPGEHPVPGPGLLIAANPPAWAPGIIPGHGFVVTRTSA